VLGKGLRAEADPSKLRVNLSYTALRGYNVARTLLLWAVYFAKAGARLPHSKKGGVRCLAEDVFYFVE
jgi:hypothetical protein